jgi:hypothetical protein
MSQLVAFDLGHNELRGTLPEEFSTLTSGVALWFNDNKRYLRHGAR